VPLWDKDDRVPRVQWLKDYNVLGSREKRARALGLPWPPFVRMGGRVFYSRQRTMEWFAAQEAKSLVGGQTP
jgi:hypothetical protein